VPASNSTISSSTSGNLTATVVSAVSPNNATLRPFNRSDPASFNFGRSPACTASWNSYYASYAAAHPYVTETFQEDYRTSTSFAILTRPRWKADEPEICCGTCYIHWPNVDVYYWPEPTANYSCVNLTSGPLQELSAADAGGGLYNSLGSWTAGILTIGTVPVFIPHDNP